jgi:hypothetical protein
MEQSSGREPEYLITSRAVALSPLAAAVAVEALITLLAGAAVQLVGVLLIFPLQEADQAEFKGLVRDLGGGAAIAEMSLTVLVFLPAALVVIPLLWRDDQPLLSRWQVASLWGVTVTNGWQVLRGPLALALDWSTAMPVADLSGSVFSLVVLAGMVRIFQACGIAHKPSASV